MNKGRILTISRSGGRNAVLPDIPIGINPDPKTRVTSLTAPGTTIPIAIVIKIAILRAIARTIKDLNRVVILVISRRERAALSNVQGGRRKNWFRRG